MDLASRWRSFPHIILMFARLSNENQVPHMNDGRNSMVSDDLEPNFFRLFLGLSLVIRYEAATIDYSKL